MGASTRSKSLFWLTALSAVALLATLLGLFLRNETPREAPTEPPVKASAPAPAPPAPSLPSPDAFASFPPPAATDTAPETTPALESSPEDSPGMYPLDLDALRQKLPDNLYWTLAVPTKEPEVLRERAEDKRRWNELFGKVQSGEASEEEIHRYFDHRRQVSTDYLEFASVVLQEYGDKLPERDRGLYELSIRMHRTRLDEIPRQVEDALARTQSQQQRREEWLRSQQRP